MTSKDRKDYKNLKDVLKIKRTQKADDKKVLKGCEKDIVEKKFLTIQQLSEETYGIKQKYNRVGPRQFVPYEFDAITFENIKEACEKYISHDTGKLCDILASEQGPSCTMKSQIPKLNLIHIRFIDKPAWYIDSSKLSVGPFSSLSKRKTSSQIVSPPAKKFNMQSAFAIPTSLRKKTTKKEEYSLPAELTVTKMLNIGKLIETKSTNIEMFSFDVKTMSWITLPTANFSICKNFFAEGGFRECYKAESSSPGYSKKVWVVKQYKQSTLDYFERTEEYNPETQAKKTVQMHQLAKNMADVLAEKAKKHANFGPQLHYINLFYGKIKLDSAVKHVSIEEFESGKFVKYINNTGDINCDLGPEFNEKREKAECLSHFSYQYSKGKLMLADVQGIGWTLIDPEIASIEVNDPANLERYFTAGNFASSAMTKFFKQHKCNEYCRMMELSQITSEGNENENSKVV